MGHGHSKEAPAAPPKEEGRSIFPRPKGEQQAPFDLDLPRYSQETYYGRLYHFVSVTDPRLLLVGDKEVEKSIWMIEEYKRYLRGEVSTLVDKDTQYPIIPAQLWRAKKVRDGIIHPDTGNKIVLPFRVSSFVPMNILITVGLLLPNPSTFSLIFWQWINQSYNIALNHCNRNASNELSATQLLGGYAAAVTTSCCVALGLSTFVKRAKNFPHTLKRGIEMVVPYTAVASASVVNVFLMRQNELREGIVVRDEAGEIVGKSAVAGKQAVSQVAISRAISCLPPLCFPPIIMAILEKTPLLIGYPTLALPINLVVIAACLGGGLPAAMALFPQRARLNTSDLEPELRQKYLSSSSSNSKLNTSITSGGEGQAAVAPAAGLTMVPQSSNTITTAATAAAQAIPVQPTSEDTQTNQPQYVYFNRGL